MKLSKLLPKSKKIEFKMFDQRFVIDVSPRVFGLLLFSIIAVLIIYSLNTAVYSMEKAMNLALHVQKNQVHTPASMQDKAHFVTEKKVYIPNHPENLSPKGISDTHIEPVHTATPAVGLYQKYPFPRMSSVMSKQYLKKHKTKAEIEEAESTVQAYVRTHAAAAQAEMKIYGIPASITLAQGLLESDAGTSRLAVENNNHFGVKCFSKSCKKGHCGNFTDDSHKDFFRKYKTVSESFRGHSLCLQKKRYTSRTKDLGTKNYRAWAKAIKAAGYATDPNYAPKLIKIIESLELHKYDK